MNSTVLKEIAAFLFGRKYYATIINPIGTTEQQISCFIFANREAAERHKRELDSVTSFKYVSTVSFRSRKIYLDSIVKS
ncbi:MAG: hypothetical protein SNH27_04945 [Rikenellaceae bacterium]